MSTVPRPRIVDRDTWQRERDALLQREKAHTREGDAIAAARRRLPMLEVENITVAGADGPVSLVDVFDGRDQLMVYEHMWHEGQPFEGQCEGCTASLFDFHDPVYLNGKGITFAVFCEGPWDAIAPFREFMGYRHPWFSTAGLGDDWRTMGTIAVYLRDGDRVFRTYETTDRGVEAMMTSHRMLDLTPYGRQEVWEDSPEGWPQTPTCSHWRRDGRPTPQWTRPGVGPVGEVHEHHHH